MTSKKILTIIGMIFLALLPFVSATDYGTNCTDISLTGNSSHRADITFVGHAYNATEMEHFRQDALDVINFMFSREPYLNYSTMFNFRIVNQSANLSCVGVSCSTTAAKNLANANCPVNDKIYILVDDAGYGGFGGGQVAMGGTETVYKGYIFSHEIGGHTFGELMDEYNTTSSGGLYYSGANCATVAQANFTGNTSIPCTKWGNISGTGCFPACSYYNLYRSTWISVMRSTGSNDFNRVSTIQVIKMVDKWSNMTIDYYPKTNYSINQYESAYFNVTKVNESDNSTVYWYLNDAEITDSRGNLSLNYAFNSGGNYTVKAIVRLYELNQTYLWNANVTGINQAPNITFYSPETPVSLDENSSLAFNITAEDPENSSLAYLWKLDNVQQSTNQNWTYTPDYDSAGNHNITVTVSDGSLTDYQYWNVTVNNVNRAPVLDAIGNKNANEESLLEFTISATDADLDSLTYSAENLPSGAAFNSTGTFSWTPTDGQNNSYQVSFNVTDGSLMDSETITISVENNNRAPVLNSISDKTVEVDTELKFNITASDADSDTLNYASNNSEIIVTKINNTLAEVSWTPHLTGINYVEFNVSDGNLTDTKTAKITVTQPNKAPVLNSISDNTIKANLELRFNMTASDDDGDTLTYASNNTKITVTKINDNLAEVVWIPGEVYIGDNYINFNVSDGNLTDTKTAKITVTNPDISDIYHCDTLSYENTAYYLQNDIPKALGTCFTINANNITFDCQNHVITGSSLGNGDSGVDISGFNSTKIKNCRFTYFQEGISLADSHFNSVVNNTFDANGNNGAYITGSSNNNFTNNTITNNEGSAIYAESSNNNIFSDNAAINNNILPQASVILTSSSNNIFLRNNLYSNYQGFLIDSSNDNNFTNNVVNSANAGDYISSTSSSNIIINMTFNSTSWPTKASFIDNGDVEIDSANAIADSGGLTNASKYLSITISSNILLNVSYDSVPPSMNEDTLKIYRNDGDWTAVLGSSVDKTRKTVYANITEPGAYALMGEKLNVAPVLDAISDKTIDESIELKFNITASDADLQYGDVLTYSVNSTLVVTKINNTLAEVSWTPSSTDIGVHYFKLKVNDTAGLENTKDVKITVNFVNEAPVLNAVSDQTINENQELKFNITASDADLTQGDVLAYSVNETLTVTKINNTLAEVVWTPGYDKAGIHYFKLKVNDSAGLEDTKDVKITVNNINRAPTLTSISDKTIAVDTELRFNITASDADNDVLAYASNNTDITVTKINNTLAEITWTPHSAGINYVEFNVTDGIAADEKTAKITVTQPNRAPNITIYTPSDNPSVDENSGLEFKITTEDPDGDSLTYSWRLDGTQKVTTQNWTYTPDYDSAGNHNITVTVSDGSLTDYQYWNVTVNNVNRAPILNSIGNKNVNEGSLLEFTVSANDADGDSMTFSAENLPSGAGFNSTGTFSWTPDYGIEGDYQVTFNVTDSSLMDSETITISVGNNNRAPVLNDIANISAYEGSAITINPSATDPDNDSLTYSYSGWMTSSSYTTNCSDAGAHQVNVTASDGSLSDSKIAWINVFNSYEFRTAISDRNTKSRLSGTVMLDGTSKSTDPSTTAIFNYVHSNNEYAVQYSASGYQTDNYPVYFDSRLADCSQGSDCSLTGAYNSDCRWNPSYTDWTCSVTKSGWQWPSIFNFNPAQNAIKRIDYMIQ